jgi:hypothetical protein
MGNDDVSKILADIPEAAALCGVECTIAENPIMAGYSDLRLHPKNISPSEQAEADWIGSSFGRFSGLQVKPTVSVVFKRGLITQVMLSDTMRGSSEGPVQATWKPQKPAN